MSNEVINAFADIGKECIITVIDKHSIVYGSPAKNKDQYKKLGE